MESWLIGVVLAILAALAGAIGDNVVKYSFTKAAELGDDAPPLHKRPLWLVGIFHMVVVNTALNVASYAFADASLTIPLGGLHILFNIPLAKWLNKESCSTKALGYNMVIMMGVIIVLAAAPKESTFFTTHQMFLHLFDPVFVVFSGVMLFCSMTLLGMKKSKNKRRKRIGYTGLTGMIGAATQVSAKAMSGCIKDGGWYHPFLWLSVVVTIFLALSEVYYLNKSLEKFETTFVVPITNAMLICLGSLYAAVYFQEVERWDIGASILVPLGIGLTAIGIALLSTAGQEDKTGSPSHLEPLNAHGDNSEQFVGVEEEDEGEEEENNSLVVDVAGEERASGAAAYVRLDEI